MRRLQNSLRLLLRAGSRLNAAQLRFLARKSEGAA